MTDPLPSGILTVLLTDIEGSVGHWEREPEAMASAVELHDHLLATAIDACGGRVLKPKLEGDSTFSVFPLADAALCAAMDAQRALAEVAWPTEHPLRVRMAIHSGKLEPRDGDYYGAVPNRAARLREVAHGGQVLVTSAAAILSSPVLTPELQLTPLGRHRLRDLSEPEDVYQVDRHGDPVAFPPLRTPENWPNNLPTVLASFVGRARELAEIRDLLATQRMMTLVGPPGVGKTRLALQAGADVLHEFSDGVWLIELAGAREGADLLMTLSTTLDVRPENDPLRSVVHRLRSDRALLIMDNCEHLVVPVAGVIHRLLSECPALAVLATSRGALGLDVEQQYDVRPLPLPEHAAPIEDVAASDAVRLFIARSHASSGLDLTDANAAHVARVCRSIDGIPLALEMAAAWTRVLGVQQIAQRLDEGKLPIGWVHPDPDGKFRTFDEAIGWSWNLLDASSRELCEGLAVFEGGARLQSLEDLIGHPCLDELATLVRQSLVQRVEDAKGSSRYRMHALIRDFARRRLAASGHEDEVRDRHARLFLDLAEHAATAMRGPELPDWLHRLDEEQPNIQAAFRHFASSGSGEEALRLSSALWFYHYMRGAFAEGREMVERALALRTPETPREVEAKALHAAGTLAAMGGATALARSHLEPAAALWRELGDHVGLANTTNNLAIAAERDHDYRGAAELYEKALELRAGSGEIRGAITTLTNLAQTRILVAELDRAEDAVRTALDLVKQLGDDRQLGELLLRHAVIEIDRTRYESAERIIAQCCVIAERQGNRPLRAGAEMDRGLIWLRTGQFEPAATHLLRSLQLWLRQRNGSEIASVRRYLGDIAYYCGNLSSARRRYQSSLKKLRPGTDLLLQSTILDSLGRVALASGDIEVARGLLAEAFDLRRALACPLPLIESIESTALLVAARGEAVLAADIVSQAEALRSEIGTPRPPLLRQHLAERILTTDGRRQAPPDDGNDWTWSGIALDDVVESARRHV